MLQKVEAGQTVKIKTIHIKGSPPDLQPGLTVNRDIPQVYKNIGTVTGLSDPRFARENYSTGMWRPLDFLDQVGGGLFFLQEYDRNTIPVLFVHGVNGGPDDFKDMIGTMDKKYFQPWVLYYPSGLRLDMISDYLLQAVIQLQNQYGFKKIDVIAHSMGGLVTRSFIKKFTQKFPDLSHIINLVMTVNSPLNGMASAASGVENSPIVVPAWRDVATGSDFIKDLDTWKWPEYIPYHLVFSYETGDSSDGAVDLTSQLPLKGQSEARRMYGFNNSHSGTLSDKGFLALFKSVMEGSRRD